MEVGVCTDLIWWMCVAVGGYKVLNLVYTGINVLFPTRFEWNKLGKWAVITGGTDGIGKSYAKELASRGFGICLISRNAVKLEAVAKEIDEEYGVPTMTVEADFTEGPELYQKLQQTLEPISDDVGVLVNNVGMSYSYAEYFHLLPGGSQVLLDLINSNVTSCTMMTKILLPKMMASDRKGVIVNVSSLTAVYPMPLLAVYAASKAYVDFFSRALHYECKGKVFVQSLLPGYVSTKMSSRKTGLEVPSPSVFAGSAIATVGRCGRTFGYLPHSIRGFVHEWLKEYFPARINMAIALHYMSRSRNAYLGRKRRMEEKQVLSNSVEPSFRVDKPLTTSEDPLVVDEHLPNSEVSPLAIKEQLPDTKEPSSAADRALNEVTSFDS